MTDDIFSLPLLPQGFEQFHHHCFVLAAGQADSADKAIKMVNDYIIKTNKAGK